MYIDLSLVLRERRKNNMQCTVYAQCKQATIICGHESSQGQKHNSIFLASVFYCRLRKYKNLLSVVQTNFWGSTSVLASQVTNQKLLECFMPSVFSQLRGKTADSSGKNTKQLK